MAKRYDPILCMMVEDETIKATDLILMKVNERFWSDKLHRYLIYKGKNSKTGKYKFEDFGDVLHDLSESEVMALKKR